MSKIKSYLLGLLAIFSTVIALLFRREKNKRKEAEDRADTAEAKNEATNEVLIVQKQINAATQKALQKPKKRQKKAKKIILPLLLFLFVGCTQIKHIPVTHAPELYVYESNVELILDEVSGNYCLSEDDAIGLQQILEAYKEQITIYNDWRKANEIR